MYAHGVITESDALEFPAERAWRATLAQQACFGSSAVVWSKACAWPAAAPTVIFATTAAGWSAARVWPVNHVRWANIAVPAAALIRDFVLHVKRARPEHFGTGAVSCLQDRV